MCGAVRHRRPLTLRLHLSLYLLSRAALIIVSCGKIKGLLEAARPCCCLPALLVTDARQSRPTNATCPAGLPRHSTVDKGLPPRELLIA